MKKENKLRMPNFPTQEKSVVSFVIILIIILIVLMLATKIINLTSFFISEYENITVVRIFPSSISVNQEFTYTLHIYPGNNPPTALGIDDYAPEGWNITSCSGDYAKINENLIEILVFSPIGKVSEKTITCKIIPTTTSGEFSGTWTSVSPDLEGNIEGDSKVEVGVRDGEGNGGGGGGGSGGGSSGGGIGECTENWQCSEWSGCKNETISGTGNIELWVKTRTCADLNNCNTQENKPLEEVSCNPVISTAQHTTNYIKQNPEVPISTGLAIGIIILIVLIITAIKTRKYLKYLKPHIERAKLQGYSLEQIKKSLELKGWPKRVIKRVT